LASRTDFMMPVTYATEHLWPVIVRFTYMVDFGRWLLAPA
jgi:hypothetical protein